MEVHIIDVPGRCYNVDYSPVDGVYCGYRVVYRGPGKYHIMEHTNDTVNGFWCRKLSKEGYNTPNEAKKAIKEKRPDLFAS